MSAVKSCAVIEFPAGRRRPVSQTAITGPAEVIIFPGVRVERLMFDLAERLPAVRNAAALQTRTSEFDFY